MLLTRLNSHRMFFFCLLTAFILTAGQLATDSFAGPRQKTFASPEEAFRALYDAVKSGSDRDLIFVLGPGSRGLVSSGDKVDDKARRERFLKSWVKENRIESVNPEKAVLHIGDREFPFPIPVLKKKGAWVFDAREGREEILNRRIGRNELKVIEVLHEYTDAQREYASKDCNGNGVMDYAQRFISSKGKKDGLFWDASGGEESPFGPLIAKAAKEGYSDKQHDIKQHDIGVSSPYHGYYYRILTSQGKHADGGAFDYKVNGRMVLGFALIAYPAKYGSSGVMTFIVNQENVVFEKDFGRDTAKKASLIKTFDPDETWKKVEQAGM